jgi:hypothetical protein
LETEIKRCARLGFYGVVLPVQTGSSPAVAIDRGALCFMLLHGRDDGMGSGPTKGQRKNTSAISNSKYNLVGHVARSRQRMMSGQGAPWPVRRGLYRNTIWWEKGRNKPKRQRDVLVSHNFDIRVTHCLSVLCRGFRLLIACCWGILVEKRVWDAQFTEGTRTQECQSSPLCVGHIQPVLTCR